MSLHLRTQGDYGWDPDVAPTLVGWRHQQCPQRPGEPRGRGVKRAGEFYKVHSALTRKRNSSSWAQRAGFTSPSDRSGCARSIMCLCPLEGKHVSHSVSSRHPLMLHVALLFNQRRLRVRQEWSSSEFLIEDRRIY